MNAILALLLILILVGFFIFIVVKNSDNSGVKFMLLGISIILVGGIMSVDTNSYFRGYEHLIVIVGLIISVVGFGKNN
ncbi:hypothetical protein [Bacillus sp. EAC]|uniref:hypothetical protein n=1 Tax=Bacillus sp. EAC TaxID=1978338 RepID=UPI000B4473AE|nr:hypothetical protein [Bacillus sp. EAC]